MKDLQFSLTLTITFNRTIVELKRYHLPRYVFRRPTFNRTIVELKHDFFLWLTGTGRAFNRTIVELKPTWTSFFFIFSLTFNRTIVELKRGTYRISLDPKRLLIEPLWN